MYRVLSHRGMGAAAPVSSAHGWKPSRAACGTSNHDDQY